MHADALLPPAPRHLPWLRLGRAGLAAAAAGVLVTLSAAWLAHGIALDRGMQALHEASQRRLETVAAELGGLVSRFEYLPALLETTPAVMNLLAAPANPALREQANLTLNRMNAMAGADMVFVLEPGGTALAAADWDQPATPVGHNYAYRPYMTQALQQGRGRFFGIGATSARAGYFLSYALRGADQRTLGVATVKVNLEPALRHWAGSPGELLVADDRGVVLMATQRAWSFRALQPLSAAQREAVQREKAYDPDPPLLRWVALAPGPGQSWRVEVEGSEHLVTTRDLPAQRWQMRALDPLAPVRAAARNAAWMAALAAAVACLLATAGWLSRRAAMHKLAAQAALKEANDQLEARVTERTCQLSEANATLAGEVEQRKAAEGSLRETQQELVHAAKLAVLGQVSAGMAHELNQPLAALRTLSDNAIVLIDKQRLPETRDNLGRISQMVGRLGELTRRLKSFAHKPSDHAVPTPLAGAVNNAHALLAERMRRHGIAFEAHLPAVSPWVLADPTLLEQVLVNLLANAVDATAQAPARHIRLQAWRDGERVLLTVGDSGAGIAPEIAAQLFEPFATSKPAGSGLGLGLMISRRIVAAFGGTLTAEPPGAGGATFRIDLPACEAAAEGAPTA